MEKSAKLSAEQRAKIVVEELERFKKLIAGHRRILEAIGAL